VALAARVKVAVTVVSFTTWTFETVPMAKPEAFTAVTSVRPVPVRVTFTLVPRLPEFGAIEVNTG
jgi:hypothetical protein